MRVLVSWLKEYVDVPVDIDTLAKDLTMRGFEVASIDPVDGRADDAVIDFEITANRPDCLSVIGMAREVAVKYSVPLREPASASGIRPSVFEGTASDQSGGGDGSPSRPTATATPNPVPGSRSPSPDEGAQRPGDLRVTVERQDLCPVYCAAVMDVTVGPSPAWLVERLTLSGVRSINNIVDATNYVLLELNQPLHAFDLATVARRRHDSGGQAPELIVRTARAGERLTTLDGVERTLADDMLVIADDAGAQAVAGVMGGAATEISERTTAIVLESAYFEPAQVRRTRRRLNLSTEASYRFERGVDPSMPPRALRRVVEIITEMGAGRARPGEVIVGETNPVPRRVTLRHPRIARVLGMEVPVDEVQQILTALGFHLRALDADGLRRTSSSAAANGVVTDGSESRPFPTWDVTVPGWRGDVTREEDLIEEVARCAGYDRLPVTFPALLAPPARSAPRMVRDARVRDALIGAGFAEAVTFTFIEKVAAAPFDAAPVAIDNPLSELFAVLRPSLLPGLIDSLSHNRRREQRDIRLFEVGTRFTTAHGETRTVAIGWTGAASPEHWSGSGRAVDLYDVLGVVQRIAHLLRVPITVAGGDHPALMPGRAARLSTVSAAGEARDVGWAGQLSPTLADARGLPSADPVLVAEIDLDLVAPHYDPDWQVEMAALPRHPSVVRDLSIVVAADLPAASVRGTIHASAPPTLVAVREFDRYQGKSLPEGKVSLSLRLTFRAADRTLTDAEVQAASDAILSALADAHGATLR